jgi:2-oxoglutarate ferredoxin oxidoreductase subunit alpha
MIEKRAEKVARMANDIPPIETFGADRGDLLLVGWGGTHGAITSAVEEAQRDGLAVSSIHLRHLNPFPSNLKQVLQSFDQVLVAELNCGQLTPLLRSKFLIDVQLLSKMQGQPFKVSEIRQRIDAMLSGEK